MGGLSLGFARSGFRITGYDINPRVAQIFSLNAVGEAVVADLSGEGCALRPRDLRDAAVVAGGPPCRPWSCLNLRNRRSEHPDYPLLGAFFRTVRAVEPDAFILENVPGLARDPAFVEHMTQIRAGYDVNWRIIRYSDFGAATARHRLIAVGFRKGPGGNRAELFFERLSGLRSPPRTVMDAIRGFAGIPRGGFPDHEWPELPSIKNYREKYRTRRFGWYRLDPDRPAPSFGNVLKTYILHPLAASRVISVREAMAIMGFPEDFRFPPGMGMKPRYQMVSDAVSPVFSQACARVMLELLRV
jgi:DNA (cytosine-5)-methyltransferase 1